jgi:hypothetical protein
MLCDSQSDRSGFNLLFPTLFSRRLRRFSVDCFGSCISLIPASDPREKNQQCQDTAYGNSERDKNVRAVKICVRIHVWVSYVEPSLSRNVQRRFY